MKLKSKLVMRAVREQGPPRRKAWKLPHTHSPEDLMLQLLMPCFAATLSLTFTGCYSTNGPLSFSSTCDPTYNPLTSLLEGMAWSHTRSCQRTVHFSSHYLVTTLFLGQNMRSISPECPLFILLWLPFLDRAWDIDLTTYISDVSSFSGQSLLTILLLKVLSYSNLSTISHLGPFLVHLFIVLSLRKAPTRLVYKPTYVFLCPLASSMHNLHSNLVSSLGLPPVSVPTNFRRRCGRPPRAAALLWQLLN